MTPRERGQRWRRKRERAVGKPRIGRPPGSNTGSARSHKCVKRTWTYSTTGTHALPHKQKSNGSLGEMFLIF